VVADFAPLAVLRGESERAARWTRAAEGWRQALDGAAWDGHWFRRAFFDDGSPLGAATNPEARIDLIAQSWAVLSRAASAQKQRQSMEAVEAHLVDHQAGLLRLLAPPLQHAQPVAGYIQSYPPGVRENGGQYSHAGVWALMAQAERHCGAGDPGSDLPWQYFTWLSPAHRAEHPVQGTVYRIEPYVMAGDTYSAAPYVGRGGWSWYTGAAAWMHRAVLESILGLRIDADALSFKPCLPSHWPRAGVTLRRGGKTLHFTLLRMDTPGASTSAQHEGARVLFPGERLQWPALASGSRFIVPLVQPVQPVQQERSPPHD
jgi:cyclic beta-1,2-glucan synthetase